MNSFGRHSLPMSPGTELSCINPGIERSPGFARADDRRTVSSPSRSGMQGQDETGASTVRDRVAHSDQCHTSHLQTSALELETRSAAPPAALTCVKSLDGDMCCFRPSRSEREVRMFKDLLVHIPTERSPRPAIDASISLAMTAGAHLDAIATGYASTSAPFVAEGGAAIASLLQLECERALERADAALRVFEVEANNAKINPGKYALGGAIPEIVSRVAAAARLYDLTIVSQGDPDGKTFDNQLPKELLLQAGGPLLFIPYTFRGAFKASRIGICWDGSRLAARALRDAMPFITEAAALTTITLNASDVPADASADRLVQHLARKGLPAKTISLESDRGSVQASILSIAADESLDLLIMGGYGHSRLQETVFGGVTREMFRSMTIPVLMSH